jgi:hypothetical protein
MARPAIATNPETGGITMASNGRSFFSRTRLITGAVSGLAGGLVFGMMMAMMGMLPMIGQMVGVPTAAAGWVVHLIIAATIGISFAVLLDWLVTGRISSVVFATSYGAVWWTLGPLTLMPLMMGMGLGVNWNLGAAQAMLPSFMGHLVFGMVLGLTYLPLRRRFGAIRQIHGRRGEAEVVA